MDNLKQQLSELEASNKQASQLQLEKDQEIESKLTEVINENDRMANML